MRQCGLGDGEREGDGDGGEGEGGDGEGVVEQAGMSTFKRRGSD